MKKQKHVNTRAGAATKTTIEVELSPAQAERINNIAEMIQIQPGELLTWLAFSEMEGWEDEPYAFLWFFRQQHEDYVKRRSCSGQTIEAMLRGGLNRMSLRELIKKAELASDPEKKSEREQLRQAKAISELTGAIPTQFVRHA